ncbi:MAG: hypothetical protein Q8K24_14045 [Hydrogenophaga sp.]|nr:hypothetical protein [Hydrogenophaga sp.]
MNPAAPPTAHSFDAFAEEDLLRLLPAQSHKTVLVVDLVESVRLMAVDEKGVVARWQGFLRFAQQTIPLNCGRLVKSLGDGLLAEFDHCRDAVKTAHLLHRYFDTCNTTLPPQRQMLLRAGVNATHLYADAHDVYGHGVNLAARVVSLARPGCTVVTSSVRDALMDGLDGHMEDMGESYLKHWPDSVRTWCVHPVEAGVPAWRPTVSTDLRPSIAVVPFDASNSAPEHFVIGELIADGVIAQLARTGSLRVLSRLSTTLLRGRRAPVDVINAKLDAAFVLSGSYATLGTRIIIMAELTDTRRGEVVWAERIAGETLDLLQVQSELLNTLSAACAHALLQAEVQRATVLPLPQLESNTLMLGSIALMHRSTSRDMQRSRELLDTLVERHARVAAPHAWLAKWHVIQVVQGESSSTVADYQQAISAADRALDLEPESSIAMAIKGHAMCHLGHDAECSRQLLDGATQINPNDPLAWLYGSLWSAMWGEPQDAVVKAENALRLSPMDPQRYYFEMMLATSYLTAGAPDQAIELCQASLARNRLHLSSIRALITASHEAGQLETGRSAFSTLMILQPELSVNSYLAAGAQSPLRRRGARALAAFGLRAQ